MVFLSFLFLGGGCTKDGATAKEKKKKKKCGEQKKKKNGQSKKYSGVETKEMKVKKKKKLFMRGRGEKQNLGEVQNQACKLLW